MEIKKKLLRLISFTWLFSWTGWSRQDWLEYFEKDWILVSILALSIFGIGIFYPVMLIALLGMLIFLISIVSPIRLVDERKIDG